MQWPGRVRERPGDARRAGKRQRWVRDLRPAALPPHRAISPARATPGAGRPPSRSGLRPFCIGPQFAPRLLRGPIAGHSPSRSERTEAHRPHRGSAQCPPSGRATPRAQADCVITPPRPVANAILASAQLGLPPFPHPPASKCAGAGSSAFYASAQAPCPSHGGWPYRGWGGGGRSSVASSPLPRWRLVPVSPQFLLYELVFLTLVRVEEVM